MRKFLEEHALEVLLIVITVVEITRWWVPGDFGSQHLYAVSHWVLSYDHGFIRRGLVGEVMRIWVPVVSIDDVARAALVVYSTFLLLLVAALFALMHYRDQGSRLFRLILLFLVNPATLSLVARDLGLFDIFLTVAAFLSVALITMKKHLWLVPIVMALAMFIHEGFLVLYAPTLLASMIFLYGVSDRKKRVLVTFLVSGVAVVVSFFLLYRYGTPTLGYKELANAVQTRAAFSVTPLSVHECYFGVLDHYRFATSSLYDAGSIANLILALLILSPTILVLLDLWSQALKNSGTVRWACALLFLSTLSGLFLMAIATDYGRWLSAVIFCNFFAIFFLVSNRIIRVEELAAYEGRTFQLLFVLIILTYVFFGPFHDWNPYPYRDSLLISSASVIAVLLFDAGYLLRRRLPGNTGVPMK
jgi:hypothetical protein